MIIDMTKRNLATLIDLIMKALILNACFIFQFQTLTLFDWRPNKARAFPKRCLEVGDRTNRGVRYRYYNL